MKSAIRRPNLKIWPLVRFWLIKRPSRSLAFQDPSAFIARKLVSGSPSGHPPSAKTTEASAREAVAEASAVARKLFREARRASPQRQNNGAHASDGAGLPWLSRKLRPSPGTLFREATGQLPAPKLRDAPLRGLTKRPLRLAGLDKVATLQALDKNGSAWPLINSLHGTI